MRTACKLLTASLGLVALTSSQLIYAASERSLYLQANAAFANKDNQRADQLTAALQNYSLYPYLRAKQLQRDMLQSSDRQIYQFVDHYKDHTLGKQVQSSYLNTLASTKQWFKLLEAYQRAPLTSAKHRCQQALALYHTGSPSIALQSAAELWNVGKSQTSACDPLFKLWMGRAGNPGNALATERAWKAIDKKQFKTAKYASKFISSAAAKADLELFWKVQKDLSLVTNKGLFNPANAHHTAILSYGIREFAKKNVDQALQVWLSQRDRFAFSQERRDYLDGYFAKRYAKRSDLRPDTRAILQRIDPQFRVDEISEWKTRVALIERDWLGVVTLIDQMPEELRSSNRWHYWRETAKSRASGGSYQANYKPILGDRDYYSYLAANLSGAQPQLNYVRNTTPVTVTQQLLAMPAVQRMRELVAMDEIWKAYQEWKLVRDKLSDEQKLALAYLANDWGWHIQGIRIAAKLKAWDHLAVRFPRADVALFEQWADNRGINRTWAVAIARQESGYNRLAKSPAGARGYMQLMPATAKQTAKKYQVPYSGTSDLYNTSTNVQLGTAYLSQMMDRFGSRAHASAAYNAGPHRVDRWLAARGHLPLDIWIETIPFDETRKYVQNVLTYSAIYDMMAGRSARLLEPVETARLALNQR